MAAGLRLRDLRVADHPYRAWQALSRKDVRLAERSLARFAGHLRQYRDGGRYPAEDLDQHAHRDEARGVRASAAASAHGSAAEPDQSALSVQYAEFCFVAGPR